MQKDQRQFCKRKTHTGEKFLEVCLLVLLSKEQSHGYGLMEKISRLGFFQKEINGSTLYRTLRKMEKDELVSSLWKTGSQGPKKRIYLIKDQGKKELKSWILFVKRRKEQFERLIDIYNDPDS